MAEQSFIDSLQFTDLHLHLGSSSTPHFLWELAHDQGIRLDNKDYFSFIESITIKDKTTQEAYHAFFDLTQRIQSSPIGVEKSVHSTISHAYRVANVSHIELRFNPMRRNKDGEHDLDKIMLAAIMGIKKVMLEYPVHAGLIIENGIDGFQKKQNEIIARKAFAFQKDGVVGIDVSGPDIDGFTVDDFVEIFKEARQYGIGTTFHTGEFTDATEVREVMEKLYPDRLGHGIASAKDEKLMKLLSDTGTVLEICPTSNIKTQVISGMSEMKSIIDAFKSHDVSFCINSDGPEFLDTNVKKEYELLYHHGVLTESDITNALAHAKKASFIKNEETSAYKQSKYFI